MVGTAKKGKIIFVDVRTREEWNNVGQADCSVNFRLDELDTLQNFGKIVLVCRTGNRAESAKENWKKLVLVR